MLSFRDVLISVVDHWKFDRPMEVAVDYFDAEHEIGVLVGKLGHRFDAGSAVAFRVRRDATDQDLDAAVSDALQSLQVRL